MCGIFGFISKKGVHTPQDVLSALKTLEYRGYDSWGLSALEIGPTKQVFLKKEVGKIGQAKIKKSFLTPLALGHTRWATHGGVTKTNAHPHLSYDGRFVLVHNGIVENYLELKQKLLKKKIQFKSETDSEVVVNSLAVKAHKLNFVEAVRQTFKELSGLNAIVVMDLKEKKLVALKNGSPLVAGIKDGVTYFASDAIALLPHTKEVHFLEENELIFGDGKNVKLLDVDTGQEKQLHWEKLNLNAEEISKDGFAHFMLKEIYEQPKVVKKIIGAYHEGVFPLEKNLAFIGCGTASYAALSAQYIFAKKGFNFQSFSGSEFSHFADNLPTTTLPIFLSQSGETIDLIEQVNFLQTKQIKIGAIVNRLSSTLERKADYKLPLLAGPEISVVSTKAFIAKLVTLILLAHEFAGDLDTGKKLLKLSLQAIEGVFAQEEKIKLIAEKITQKLQKTNQKSVFAIGRGLDYPVALELALKAKEASYTHMEAFAGGELKHGVISLIEPGTICLVFVGDESVISETISNAIEIKSRGGYIIGISHQDHPVFDELIEYQDTGLTNMMPEVVIAQLLGYYLSLGKDLDPDKPRNLAKSVTVK